MASMVVPAASAVGVTAIVVVVLFVILATMWIPLKMGRDRRRGEKLMQQDPQGEDLAAEVEQMRRAQAGESSEAEKS